MALIPKLVEFGERSRFENLPTEVIVESKRILLDSIGCALAGLTVDKGHKAIKAARAMSGSSESMVIGSGDKLSMGAAAFANGELINAIDFDLLTIPPGHVTPYVLPASLAMAEGQHRSGKDLIAAIAISHEVSTRFGLAMGYYRDITPGQKLTLPSISGFSSTIFGGTLASSLLRGLDARQTGYAMGLAGHMAPAQSMSKWGRTIPGPDNKYLMSGWMAQAELTAVQLAEAGYSGDTEILEGEHGFWRFMGSTKWNPDALMDRLYDEWKFPAVTIYKPYPHCRNTHTILDCILNLIEVHRLRPEEIDRIVTYSDSHTAKLPLYSAKTIQTPSDAQMNTAYAVSMAIHGVKPGPEWHDDESLRSKKYLAFMEKVQIEAHPDFEQMLTKEPQSRIGKVEIFARGETFAEERKYRKGSPATSETRMSDNELADKFRHCASRVLSPERSDQVITAIMDLETIGDVAKLAVLWQGDVHDESSRDTGRSRV
jgi:2-methylcitrate dehydratase PrpD